MEIIDISLENRPRERLIKNDSNVLSDAELFALILKMGNKTENVIDMSNKLLSKYGFDKFAECYFEAVESK